MTTLKQVAEAAGVSIRTVTRALKNETGGNARTYEKVLAVADQLRYVPNIAARNLKTRQSHMVGLVSSSRHSDVNARKRKALERRLESLGKYLISGTLSDSEAHLNGMLKDWIGLARDVVFLSWGRDFSPDKALADLPMRFIFVDAVDAPGYDTLLTDRVPGIREGVEWFIKAGRRRIARCGTNQIGRQKGFESAFERPATAAEKYKIDTPHLEFEDGFNAGREIVRRKIDAVFFETDRMAFGFYKFAKQKGIRIPDDVAVIGFDDEPADLYTSPTLSTVAHPIEEIAEHVSNLVQVPDAPPARIKVPTRFIPRESA